MSFPADWLEGMLHRLKQEGASYVLPMLTALFEQAGQPEAMQEHLSSLRKREAHMDYPTFQAQGWPIGSGMVESSNKRVMQARLKGAGMHWLPDNVNPMLALRMNLCNQRWKEGWTDQQRWHAKTRETNQRQRQQQRMRVKEQQARELRALVAPPVPVSAVQPLPSSSSKDAPRPKSDGDAKPSLPVCFVKGGRKKMHHTPFPQKA